MRKTGIAVLAVTAAVLAGCSQESSSSTKDQATTTVTSQAITEEPSNSPTVIRKGAAYDIPCAKGSASTCMTVKFTDVRANADCQLYGYSLKNGQAIAVDIKATMPSSATSSFISPFRSFPWSTFSRSNEFTRVQTERCNSDSSNLNLMAEFPGGNAKATIYLDAPTDTRAVVFEPNTAGTFLLEVE